MIWAKLDDGWAAISKKGNLKRRAVKHLDSIFKAKGVSYEIPYPLLLNQVKILSSGKIDRIFHKVKIFMDFQKEAPKVDCLTAIERLGLRKKLLECFLSTQNLRTGMKPFEDPENYGAEFKDRILVKGFCCFFLSCCPYLRLIVSLLYIRRKFNYTENLVFVFHVQTVFFSVAIALYHYWENCPFRCNCMDLFDHFYDPSLQCDEAVLSAGKN